MSQAIEYLPGVSVDHKSPRNQTGISIGGFDGRQVPLFLDGIPAYVPFDGYVDLNRYPWSDIAGIQVAKCISPLLGPNALGGVINLVTKQPHNKLDAAAFIVTASGNLLNSGWQADSRWRLLRFGLLHFPMTFDANYTCLNRNIDGGGRFSQWDSET